MREYKFRGKAKATGEWVYGDLIHRYDNWTYIAPIPSVTNIKPVEVDPETVGQFTGVKERYPQMVGEGQEIYFGDVVRLFGGEYCQGYYEHDQTIVVKSAYDIVAMEESENVQLLGNRWDNPELLKEVEKCMRLIGKPLELTLNLIKQMKDDAKASVSIEVAMSLVYTIEALQAENEQLQAQNAAMREMIIDKTNALKKIFNKMNYTGHAWMPLDEIDDFLASDAQQADYHNPADVAEIERLNGLVGCGCGICLAHNNMICPRLVKKDKVIGGKEDE